MKNEILKRIDIDKLVNDHGICKVCGKSFIDTKDLENVYVCKHCSKNSVIDSYIRKINKGLTEKFVPYIESPENRWAVNGKKINGKVYYRHVCWKCYEKALYENVDVKRKARKNAWYRSIVENGFTPPPACVSPNTTFKYLFDVPEEELDKARAKLATASKKYWVDKLGEEAGEKRYNQITERQAYTASTEYFIKERGLSKQEAEEFHKSRACTLKNFISRYGEEEGKKRWDEYCEREAYAGNKLEYFIEKYGETEGREKYLEVCDKKQLTEENFVRKYGKTEGLKRWAMLTCGRQHSMISQVLFKQLDEYDPILKAKSKYGDKNGELHIKINNDTAVKNYYADYAFFNKIIEFNGDVWHANPKKYNADDFITIKNQTVKEIWEHDKKRIELIESLGYKVKTIWESDYKDNPEKVIKECHEFLRS